MLAFPAEQAGRAGGVNWAVALHLTVYQAIWSMLVPIVLRQTWSVRGRGRPWLSGRLLAGCAVVVGLVVPGSLSDGSAGRVCAASRPAVSGGCVRGRRAAALLVLAGVVVALLLPRLRPGTGRGARPSDRVLPWLGAGFWLAPGLLLRPSAVWQPGGLAVKAVVPALLAIAAVLAWSPQPELGPARS